MDRNPIKIADETRTDFLGSLIMDGEEYIADKKAAVDAPSLEDGEKPSPRKELEPFGDEETADVKYRTMKWW